MFQPMPLSTSANIDDSVTRSLVYRPSLIGIWADADPTPLRHPAASVDVSADIGRMSLPYVSIDTRRPASAVAGPRLLESTTSVFAGAPSAAVAHPGGLDVVSSRTRMRSDTPMLSSDVGQRGLARPMRIDVPRQLELTLSVASGDVVHPCAPSPVDVDIGRSAYDSSVPTASDVAYSLPPGKVAPLPGQAPLTRDVGLKGLGGPTSGNVARYPSPLSVSVDVVRQPHLSLMSADVVKPTPTRADVVHPSSMGADATRPMTIGGTHPLSVGAGVVGPMPAHVPIRLAYS